MRVSPLPQPPTSRSRLRVHRHSPFPRCASTIPPPDRPPRRFQKSRTAARSSRAPPRSLAHMVRAPHGPCERRSLHPSAFRTRRTPYSCHKTRRCRLAPGMMSGAGHRRLPQGVGISRRRFERSRMRNAKEARLRPARKTSGRRRTYLTKQTRTGESIKAAAISLSNRRRMKPNSGEMEAFGLNRARIAHGINSPPLRPS